MIGGAEVTLSRPTRGCSSVVEHLLAKERVEVRISSSAYIVYLNLEPILFYWFLFTFCLRLVFSNTYLVLMSFIIVSNFFYHYHSIIYATFLASTLTSAESTY